MAIWEQFPFTDFHGENIDWVLSQIKDMDDRLGKVESEVGGGTASVGYVDAQDKAVADKAAADTAVVASDLDTETSNRVAADGMLETAVNAVTSTVNAGKSSWNNAAANATTALRYIQGTGTYPYNTAGDIATRLSALEAGGGTPESGVTKAYVDAQDNAIKQTIGDWSGSYSKTITAKVTEMVTEQSAQADDIADNTGKITAVASTADSALTTATSAKTTADTAASAASAAATAAAEAKTSAATANSGVNTVKTWVTGSSSGTYDTSKGSIASRLTAIESKAGDTIKWASGTVSAFATTGKESTLNYASAGFTAVPVVLTSYSTTGSNPSVNGFIKVYNKTATSATLTLSASSQANVGVDVDWIAIGV